MAAIIRDKNRLTYNDQIAYNTFIAKAAHARGLSVDLKNDLDQITDLLPSFDWALDEQCFQYSECGKLLPFIKADKAVFEVEYSLPTRKFCPEATMAANSTRVFLLIDAIAELWHGKQKASAPTTIQ